MYILFRMNYLTILGEKSINYCPKLDFVYGKACFPTMTDQKKPYAINMTVFLQNTAHFISIYVL